MCMCVWSPKDHFRCHLSVSRHLVFEDGVSYWPGIATQARLAGPEITRDQCSSACPAVGSLP